MTANMDVLKRGADIGENFFRMKICEQDLAVCFGQYGINKKIKNWHILADGPDHPVPYEVIRLIIYAELEDETDKYVVKYVREPVFTTEIIENQCAFSNLLRDNGIRTPFRLKANGHYCTSYTKNGLRMDVTIEEWVGEKPEHMTMDLFEQVGRTLGKSHRVSLEHGPEIGYSLLYDEVTTKDTSYERIWKTTRHDFISPTDLKQILSLYEKRINIIKKNWTKLPRAAVQGDIYSCNNFTVRNGTLVMFDFNLAGDEVLIGDMLLCWFRTIFDENMQEDLKNIRREDLWLRFIQAYQKERPFTEIEKQYLADAYALFGTLYYTKLLVYYVQTGQKLKAAERYRDTIRLLNVLEVPI